MGSILTLRKWTHNVTFKNGFRLQGQNHVGDIVRRFSLERNVTVRAAGDFC